MRASRWCAARAGAAILAVCLGAGPALARAGTPVAIYPPQGAGLTEAEVTDLQDLLAAGLRTAAQRRGNLSPAKPLVLPPTCGAPPKDACLAGLAKGGAVLVSKVTRRPVGLVVTLALVDAAGVRTRPEAFVADLAIQSAAPADHALSLLEFKLGAPPAPPPVAAAPAPAPSAPLAPRPPPPDPLRLAEPAAPAAGPGTPWQSTAGSWCVYGGLAALAGGVTFGLLGKQLTSELNDKAASGRLTAADASSYDRVKTYGTAATALLVAGGVSTATGLVFWSIAPEVTPVRGGATFGVSGRFP